MNKEELKESFTKYSLSQEGIKREYAQRCIALLEKYDDTLAFTRKCFDDGHFTASTFVVNPDYTRILLMHHIKFDRWQQFWGHADGEINLKNVALRELEEESWIPMNEMDMQKDILELDIHEVIESWDEPTHLHYDVRYLVTVQENIALQKEDTEVHDIAWFDLDEVISSDDPKFQSSMKYSLQKIKQLQK